MKENRCAFDCNSLQFLDPKIDTPCNYTAALCSRVWYSRHASLFPAHFGPFRADKILSLVFFLFRQISNTSLASGTKLHRVATDRSLVELLCTNGSRRSEQHFFNEQDSRKSVDAFFPNRKSTSTLRKSWLATTTRLSAH